MRRVLVTGAGTGLGKAIAIELGKQGHEVVLHYRNSAKGAEEAQRIIEENGGKASTVQFDLTNRFTATTPLPCRR